MGTEFLEDVLMDLFNLYFRMDEKWIYQPWYDPNSVFKLIEITQNKIEHFGVDCIWENVQTGFRTNHWDRTMRILTKDELRDYKISQIYAE